MKGAIPSLVPQELPVEESWPDAFACTQEVAELPKPETTRLVEEARPTLFTEKRVVVAEAVEEPIANSVVLVEPLFAWTESVAQGVVDAMPIEPVVGSFALVPPKVTVVVAGNVPKRKLPMFRVLLEVVAGRSALNPMAMLFEPTVSNGEPPFMFPPAKAPR